MKKNIYLALCFALISVLFFSCRKETALTIDRVPPKVTFRIQGGGNDNTFEATGAGMSPSGSYYFKENTRYTITVTVSDTSGLGQLIFKTTKSAAITDYNITGAPTAVLIDNPTDYQHNITVGREEPYTSFLMTGSFLTATAGFGVPQDIRFSVLGRDYLPNQTTIYLNGELHSQPPSGSFGWNPF
ncbi:MAG: hypothetical protein IT256_07155 [Chitinophagaceae bacterium]|nr:hypothetical protein [Chitinophagaceae bacterium]